MPRKRLGDSQKSGFQEGHFGRCSPVPRSPPKKSFPAVLPRQKKAMIFDVPGPQNGNEGAFSKTTLLQNRRFVSSRGTVWGRVPIHPVRPNLIYVYFHID